MLLLAACAGTREPAPAQATPSLPETTAPATSATEASAAGDVLVGSGSMQVRAPAPTTAKARPGYKLRQRNGEAVYCRSETPTGSRMAVETCYTATQLERLDDQAEIFKDAMDKHRAKCAGPNCSGS
jgi:hypothetical protein